MKLWSEQNKKIYTPVFFFSSKSKFFVFWPNEADEAKYKSVILDLFWLAVHLKIWKYLAANKIENINLAANCLWEKEIFHP